MTDDSSDPDPRSGSGGGFDSDSDSDSADEHGSDADPGGNGRASDAAPDAPGGAGESGSGASGAGDASGKGAAPDAAERFEADPPAPDEVRREDRGTVVPKANFCEQCEHFADPPRVACTHGGTEILELVDREHFRVVNCPVVAERERLREGGPVPDENGSAAGNAGDDRGAGPASDSDRGPDPDPGGDDNDGDGAADGNANAGGDRASDSDDR